MFDYREALIFISILSIIFFFIITIIRIVAIIFYKYTIKKYLQLLSLIRPKDNFKQDDYIPSSRNDVMYRDKDIEKRKQEELEKIEAQKRSTELQGVKRINSVEGPSYKKNIVGMVKPIGYWTSLIMGQRVTSLMQQAEILKSQNDAGYWVNMMHARNKGQGKQRGM